MIDRKYAYHSVVDPRKMWFDITDEREYLKSVIDALFTIDREYPNRKYIEIYYQRYVKNYDNSLICRVNNITDEELTSRLIDLAMAARRLNCSRA